MSSDRTPLTKDGVTTPAGPLYHDSSQTPRSRLAQILFVGLVIIMVIVTVSLSIYRGVVLGGYGSLYFLMGLSLVGLVLILIILILLIRRDDIPKEKTWFLYMVGFCVLLEAIFTDILLFR